MTSDQPGGLAAALAALQTNLPHIGKDAAAIVKGESKSGKEFTYGYKYADLATITRILLPAMAKLGLIWTCYPEMQDGKFGMSYRLGHVSSIDTDWIGGFWPIALGTPQAMGGAITYARRYCLLAVTGAAPDEDDDDGQAAEAEARRLYLRAPETRADGSATEAEIMRMQRGPVPGVERSQPQTPERTEWDSDEPSKADPKTGAMNAMFGIYAELGIREKEPMLADIAGILGHPVGSRADLSVAEITTVNMMLRRRRDAQRAGKEPADA